MADAGDRFDELVKIMATLRGPEGCPWDREQTLSSLRPFLLEETYEALAALDHGDMAGLREELGDLLFEIVFLARKRAGTSPSPTPRPTSARSSCGGTPMCSATSRA
jgi:tetrapyrrole methylase family protein/MazG family protein